MNINLDGPKTLTLSPNTLAAVLDALSLKPYKDVVGPIKEIVDQLKVPERNNGPTESGRASS